MTSGRDAHVGKEMQWMQEGAGKERRVGGIEGEKRCVDGGRIGRVFAMGVGVGRESEEEEKRCEGGQ